jgi:hypothetical protein
MRLPRLGSSLKSPRQGKVNRDHLAPCHYLLRLELKGPPSPPPSPKNAIFSYGFLWTLCIAISHNTYNGC